MLSHICCNISNNILRNGQLKEYITAGVTKQEFLRRIQVVFQSRVDIQPQQASSETTDNSLNPSSQSPRLVPGDETPVSPAVASSSHVAQGSSESGIPDQTRDREREAVEKAKRVAESNAKKSAVEKKPSATTPSTADMKYALMQKKRQQEARDERARILKRVEADKVERRKRETERRAGASAKESQGTGQSTSIKSTSTSTPTQGQSKECALQIRLFDGSTIRKRFSTQGTLRADVRPWIDQQQTIDTPYTFKHVLTPQPNKNISISDEEKTLLSQGLAPTATLILVSVQSYTSAYDDAGATGFVSRGISAGYGVVSSGVGLVTGVLGSLLGGRAAPDPALSDNATPSSNQTSNINVRTLRDQDRREDHQFYNGNAVSLLFIVPSLWVFELISHS